MRQQAAALTEPNDRPLGCAFKGCTAHALDDSFYCAPHRPALQMDQSTRRMPLRWQAALAGGITALFLWVVPWLSSAIKSAQSAGEVVQTFVLYVACPRRPALGEQLVILAGDGNGRPECVYVSSRGAYGVTR